MMQFICGRVMDLRNEGENVRILGVGWGGRTPGCGGGGSGGAL